MRLPVITASRYSSAPVGFIAFSPNAKSFVAAYEIADGPNPITSNSSGLKLHSSYW